MEQLPANVLLNNIYLRFNSTKMNRLVIIGNGFDLAHGLPTGYCDFINWYWRSMFEKFFKESKYEDDILSFKIIQRPNIYYGEVEVLKYFLKIRSYKDYINFLSAKDTYTGGKDFMLSHTFINNFFEEINDKNSIQNWVDIENEYYQFLKGCLKEDNSSFKVKTLNEEFIKVKDLFIKYLKTQVFDKYEFANSLNLKRYFNIDERGKELFSKEFHFQN